MIESVKVMLARAKTRRADASATKNSQSRSQLKSPETKGSKMMTSPVMEDRGRWNSGTTVKRTDSRQNLKQQAVQKKQAIDIQRQKRIVKELEELKRREEILKQRENTKGQTSSLSTSALHVDEKELTKSQVLPTRVEETPKKDTVPSPTPLGREIESSKKVPMSSSFENKFVSSFDPDSFVKRKHEFYLIYNLKKHNLSIKSIGKKKPINAQA